MIRRRSFLVFAFLLFGARLVLRALGAEESTSILSGGAADEVELSIGLGYVMLHFLVVVLVPILVLGTGIDWIASRAARTMQRRAA